MPMDQATDDQGAVFIDGYESGRAGAPRTDNPHAADSSEHTQWLKGWDEGCAKRGWVNAKPDPDAPASE
jgi:ribosome modulation factor